MRIALGMPAALLLLACLGCAPPAPRTNLLLVSLDTLRADHVRAYGYERDTTPHLDRLAEQGTLFETMIAESSWTLPSHMTLFTGRSSRVHGVSHDGARLGPRHPPLAERLRAAGYRTEGFVSAPYVHPICGFDRGFERYRVLGETVYDEEGFGDPGRGRDPGWKRRLRERDPCRRRSRGAGRRRPAHRPGPGGRLPQRRARRQPAVLPARLRGPAGRRGGGPPGG